MKYLLPFLILLGIVSCKSEKNEGAAVEIIRPVKYTTIKSMSGSGSHYFNGVAQAERESNLSFKVGGNVRSLNAKVGDKVSKGKLLATIDASDYTIQADQAKASTKGAEAQVKTALTQMQIAKSTYERIERLYENNSVSVSEFDQAKSQYEAAKSQYEAAQTQVTSASKQVQAASNQVSYTRLYAPFSGIITEQMIELNELAGAGTPIFKLSSEGKPEVNVGIPENYIGEVKRGQSAKVTFSVLGDQTFAGKISEISYATQGGTTYPTIIKLDKVAGKVKPGMAATVELSFDADHQKEDHSGIVVPMSAIGQDQVGNYVFLLVKKEEDKYAAKKTKVEIGSMMNDGFQVTSGLKEGDVIATAGLSSLLDGMTVKLLN